jgi:tetratricopeptide (TPR) repeat protein
VIVGLSRAETALSLFFLGELNKAISEASKARNVASLIKKKGARREKLQIELKAASATGLSQYVQGNLAETFHWAEEACQKAHDMGDHREESVQLVYLAQQRSHLAQEYKQAIEEAKRAIDLATKEGLKLEQSYAKVALSFTLIEAGKYAKAVEPLESALSILMHTRHPTWLTFAYWCLSFAKLWLKDIEGAFISIQQGCSYHDIINDPAIYAQLGIVWLHRSNPTEAVKAFEAAINYATTLQDQHPQNCEGLGFMTIAYGGIALAENDPDKAREAAVPFSAIPIDFKRPGAHFIGRNLAAAAAGLSSPNPEILSPLFQELPFLHEAFTTFQKKFPK